MAKDNLGGKIASLHNERSERPSNRKVTRKGAKRRAWLKKEVNRQIRREGKVKP